MYACMHICIYVYICIYIKNNEMLLIHDPCDKTNALDELWFNCFNSLIFFLFESRHFKQTYSIPGIQVSIAASSGQKQTV